ncbi:MAG: hypothetical protein ABIO65_07165, partial [Nitrospiria bacterium]
MNRLLNIATTRDRLARWTATMALAGLAGCGGPSGGTPTGDLICRGEGTIVGGKVTFVKRRYNDTGLTGIRDIMPARYALVEIVLEIDGRSIASTYTNADGNYCVAVNAPADFPMVYPRVASLTNPAYLKVVVHDDQTPPNLFSSRSASLNGSVPGVTYRDIAVPLTVRLGVIDHPVSGAFNILDVLTTGTEKAVALTGRPPAGTLYGVWRPGTYFGGGTEGTYFVGYDAAQIGKGGGDGYIVLSGGEGGGPDAGNHDEFDDDVILHEAGHFVAHAYSRPAEIGGPHYLNDHTQDIRLAWSEGWASFFSSAVRGKSS